MRSLIRQHGRVDAVSERQDTHLGQMIVSAVFREDGSSRYEPSILGTVSSTDGPVSPLSFSGDPRFLNAFNTVEGSLDANHLTATSGNSPDGANHA